MSIWRAEGSRSRNAANCSPAARGGRSTSTRGSRCTVSWQRPNSSLGGIDGRRRFPAQQKGPAVSSQALGVIGGANRDRTGDLYNAIVRDRVSLEFALLRRDAKNTSYSRKLETGSRRGLDTNCASVLSFLRPNCVQGAC